MDVTAAPDDPYDRTAELTLTQTQWEDNTHQWVCIVNTNECNGGNQDNATLITAGNRFSDCKITFNRLNVSFNW